jgi:sugar/nucleoside kinase (ribokinase family)
MSRVLVVGDVVDDVLVRPLGRTAVASDTEAQIAQQPGGSAANVAAWLGSVRAQVGFVGRAGTDGVRRHTDALAGAGVDARILADPERRTATIVLLVDAGGERTMFVDRGANASLLADDVDAACWEGVGWLHLTGYSFFCAQTRPAALELLARARRLGVRVCVDPSSAGFLEHAGSDFLGWVAGVDLLVPNADEARVLTGVRHPEGAARRLLANFPEVVVTCGADGAVRVASDGVFRQEAGAVRVLDTTGAGDAFCAGLLDARARGLDVPQQLGRGAELAARCVSRLGARPSC